MAGPLVNGFIGGSMKAFIMFLVLSIPFHFAQAQYSQTQYPQAQQLWPPGQYCGFIADTYVGVTVHPAQPDGTFKVSTSSAGNRSDRGSYKYTDQDDFYPMVLNIYFKPEIKTDGTVNLLSRGIPIFTGLRYENGKIFGGKWHGANDLTFPANFGSCAGFKPGAMRWLFDTPGFYRSERYAPQPLTR
jgi:hypothetical protein